MKAPIVKGIPDPTVKEPAGVSVVVDVIQSKVIISIEGLGSVGLSVQDTATLTNLLLDAMMQIGYVNYGGRAN